MASRKPTEEEKKAFKDLCTLKREKDALEKALKDETKDLASAVKETRGFLDELLGENECMQIDEKKFVRRVSRSTLRALKPEAVQEALMVVTRAEIMGAVKGNMTVWDALVAVVFKKVNASRRTTTETVTITTKEPPKSCEIARVTEEMAGAVARIEEGNAILKRAREERKSERDSINQRMDDCKGTILGWMKRAKKDKQNIHIGVVDNIQRSYSISRKQRRCTSLNAKDAMEKVKRCISSLRTLDDFFDNREEMVGRIVDSIRPHGEEYVSLKDSGLREL